MKKLTANDPETHSTNVIAENTEHLKTLFPEVFTEGKVDFEVLKQLLGGAIDEREEKYSLNWHGKRQARQLALTPSTGTLRPCPEESVDWNTTQNLMIEGDNLEVLKLLQKSYAGKVKLIYIDPPYNTGNDFVYPDDYRDNIKNYLELTGQIDSEKRKLSSNTEASGRFHTDWLNMMYPRLRLARNLLRNDGVIFVSIDDTEQGNLRTILSEIFGEENFQADISWQKRYTRSNNTVDFTTVVEHLLVYSKNEEFSVNLLERTPEADARYSNPDNDPRGPWKGASFLNPATPQQRRNLCYPIKNPNTGQVTNPSTNAWRRSAEEFERLMNEDRLYWGVKGDQPIPTIKMFLSEARRITPINFWEHGYAGNTDDGTRELKAILGEKVFDNPKPVQLIRRILEHGSDSESIVLDFFAGSGTTGHAVITQNASDGGKRRFILVQLPEPLCPEDKREQVAANYCNRIDKPQTIAEITKERLRRVADSIKSNGSMFSDDVGFRAFKLDSSNIREWSSKRENLEQSLIDSVEHLKSDRTEDDVVFELVLKLGLDLCKPLIKRNIAGKEVYGLDDGSLFVCLAPKLMCEDIDELAQGLIEWYRSLEFPGECVCIFRDAAFANDVVKVNLAAILEQSGLKSLRSL